MGIKIEYDTKIDSSLGIKTCFPGRIILIVRIASDISPVRDIVGHNIFYFKTFFI